MGQYFRGAKICLSLPRSRQNYNSNIQHSPRQPLLVILLSISEVLKVRRSRRLLVALIILVHGREHARSSGGSAPNLGRTSLCSTRRKLEQVVQVLNVAALAASHRPRGPVRKQRLSRVARGGSRGRRGARYRSTLGGDLLELLFDQGLGLVRLRIVEKNGAASGL